MTAKLCKLAKGARAAEMSLHPARLWTDRNEVAELALLPERTAQKLIGNRPKTNRGPPKN